MCKKTFREKLQVFWWEITTPFYWLYDVTIKKIINKITNYEYICYLEEQISKVYCEFANLSYPTYKSDYIIDLIYEKQNEKYREIYKSDIEDILSEYREVNSKSKSSLIKELESYFEINKEFIEERERQRFFWKNYVPKSIEDNS